MDISLISRRREIGDEYRRAAPDLYFNCIIIPNPLVTCLSSQGVFDGFEFDDGGDGLVFGGEDFQAFY